MNPGLSSSKNCRGRKAGGHSLQRKLADALRQRILNRQLAPGSKLPTFREIATEFDVSTMTVFKALEQLERENHVYRVAGLGAFVKPDAGGDASVGNVLGFSAANLASPLALGIMHGVEKACQAKGWGVQIFDAQFDDERQLRNIQRLKSSGLRGGIIFPPCSPASTNLLGSIARDGYPLVFVDQLPFGVESDFVASDHEAGAFLATQYLLQHGFSHVHMLTFGSEASGVSSRLRGYERALRNAGIEPRPEWMIWIDSQDNLAGYREGRKWFGGYKAILPTLRAATFPIAILAIDAHTQWGVYEACHELGLNIPNDVSVIGFDDSEISQLAHPPMTIISQRTDDIGRMAFDLLLHQITSNSSSRQACRVFTHQLVDMDMIERQSVGMCGK